jgi:hypothetical protein
VRQIGLIKLFGDLRSSGDYIFDPTNRNCIGTGSRRMGAAGTATVAQTSKSAVSRVSKPAGRAFSSTLPTWKSAI